MLRQLELNRNKLRKKINAKVMNMIDRFEFALIILIFDLFYILLINISSF